MSVTKPNRNFMFLTHTQKDGQVLSTINLPSFVLFSSPDTCLPSPGRKGKQRAEGPTSKAPDLSPHQSFGRREDLVTRISVGQEDPTHTGTGSRNQAL